MSGIQNSSLDDLIIFSRRMGGGDLPGNDTGRPKLNVSLFVSRLHWAFTRIYSC